MYFKALEHCWQENMESGPLFVERMFYLKNMKKEGIYMYMIGSKTIVFNEWIVLWFRCWTLDNEEKVKRITYTQLLRFWKYRLQ